MVWWMWLLAGISLIGVILNIRKRRACFVIWIFTNASWMVVDWQAGLVAQSVVFMAYTGLAVWGLWEWRKGKHKVIYTDGVHLVGDNLEELHTFAQSIGLKRQWFQEHPRHPHYDITTLRMLRKILNTNMVATISTKQLFSKG